MLDGFPGPGHVHAVGEVGPAQLGVGHLLLQHLIGAESHYPRDVIILQQGRTNREMRSRPGSVMPAGLLHSSMQCCKK